LEWEKSRDLIDVHFWNISIKPVSLIWATTMNYDLVSSLIISVEGWEAAKTIYALKSWYDNRKSIHNSQKYLYFRTNLE